ncbi:2OG-Fe dioxygenase family protein [Janthinobacterium sp. 17J80-10]|uniref:2OG-Fe dioxygenase family protein n=1 Tax=Janthinobacterium sp. 17J80-10 TaxID=2497863 RepID=UPI0010055061|nr:2OG-Fe dioxygenase family protein [Janthinobacterium sp. 17J80-10]QAU33341.1 hypothetical protein EKL02_03615 [Janthinobacterium sp. 17J80-10]
MPIAEFAPPFIAPDQLPVALRTQGYGLLSPDALAEFAHTSPAELEAMRAGWNDLPPDLYLKDGGRYRRRRHASFVIEAGQVRQVPHRAHWQPTEYNALHGGMQRMFEPVTPATIALPVWSRLLRRLGELCSELRGEQAWYVEAHQFRIDTTDGIGRPTPEGAHRDGVDFVAILFVGRDNVKGGESRVFDIAGPAGQRFTLSQPWTLLMLDDERVIHETTPLQPIGEHGYRDTLVLTFRKGGFLEEA